MSEKLLIFIIPGFFISGSLLMFIAHIGFFENVKIQEKKVGPYTLICEKREKNYKKNGKKINSIYTQAKSLGFDPKIGVKINYENSEDNGGNLGSEVGVIVKKDERDMLAEVKRPLSVKKIPEMESVFVEFPYRSRTSIFTGALKIYPKIENYKEEHGYAKTPIIEMYDAEEMKIYYITEIKENNV